MVISLTKIIHEFAHALACKCFGGECREMGVMFLVGVPCLYCDVSDAWLLDRRWQRILVSAAGMLAELTLAAIAAVIWLFALDGPVRDVCVTVMVVCSITTVLFNGNPLLRYDGYFILSDLVGIPNLSGESSAIIRGWLRRFLWATPVPRLTISSHAVRRNAFVVCYGIASGLYRLVVYLFILLMLYRVAEGYELGGPVGLLGLFAIFWFCFKWGKSILTPPHRSIRRASLTTRRPALLVSVAAISVVLISLIPLPQSVVAPMSIQPTGARAVFVAREGAVTDSLGNGADVSEGQVIARLLNPQIDRELAAASSECDRLAAELLSLRQRRGSDRQLSSQIPAVEKALEEAVKRRNLQESAAEHLTLRSPQQGRLFAPPRRMPTARQDYQPDFWTGTPMQPENRGAWLEEGTVLCFVGDKIAREAIVLLRQQDVELIRPNQRVSLLLADRSRDTVTGRVLEVAATPLEDVPSELQNGRLVDPLSVESGRTPMYQVRVSLSQASVVLPVRMTGRASIGVSYASILSRLSRFLSDLFG